MGRYYDRLLQANLNGYGNLYCDSSMEGPCEVRVCFWLDNLEPEGWGSVYYAAWRGRSLHGWM